MRNGVQMIGTNGKRCKLSTQVSVSSTVLFVLLWNQMVVVVRGCTCMKSRVKAAIYVGEEFSDPKLTVMVDIA